MAVYKIEISRSAEKQIEAMPHRDRLRVIETIQALASEPHPAGSKKLSGYRDVFRVRTGNYRILYSVERARILVVVLKVGHRKDVYR